MTVPLIALAIPSIIIGFLTVGPMLFGHYFDGAIQVIERNNVLAEMAHEFGGPLAFGLKGLLPGPFYLAVLGIVTAWVFVLWRPQWGSAVRQHSGVLYKILVNKYFFDWINENIIARLTRWIGILLWRGGDQGIIDGAVVNGSAGLIGWIAGVTRHLQSGFLYSYAFWMIIGLAVLLGWFLTHI